MRVQQGQPVCVDLCVCVYSRYRDRFACTPCFILFRIAHRHAILPLALVEAYPQVVCFLPCARATDRSRIKLGKFPVVGFQVHAAGGSVSTQRIFLRRASSCFFSKQPDSQYSIAFRQHLSLPSVYHQSPKCRSEGPSHCRSDLHVSLTPR